MSNSTTTPDTIFRTSSDLAAFWLLGYIIVSFLGVSSSSFSNWTNKKKRKKKTKERETRSERSQEYNIGDHYPQVVGSFDVTTQYSLGYVTASEARVEEDESRVQWLESRSSRIPCYPPVWVFSAAWSMLYFLMMVSFFLFFRRMTGEPGFVRDVSGVFILVTLLLNKFWPIIFFKNRMPGAALMILVLLIISATCILGMFGTHGDLWISFGLLIPYAIWLIFACYLNVAWLIVDANIRKGQYHHQQ